MGNTDTKALEWTNGMRILKMKHDSPAEKAGIYL